jgi:hypothetical protein
LVGVGGIIDTEASFLPGRHRGFGRHPAVIVGAPFQKEEITGFGFNVSTAAVCHIEYVVVFTVFSAVF